MKHLLVIGGRDPSVVKPASLGIRITLFQIPEMFNQVQADHVDHYELFDFKNSDESIKKATCLHSEHPFDAVVSFWEEGLEIASLIGERLTISCNPLFPVVSTRNKIQMRKLLGAIPMNMIKFKECFTKNDLLHFIPTIKSTGILKPKDNSGSRGVYGFYSRKEAELAWDYTSQVSSMPLLVEELIIGPEYSVESLSICGKHEILAITAKETTGPPNFIETGHKIPAVISTELMNDLNSATIHLLQKIGHRNGPGHSEFKINSMMKPIIIESHTRIGGDQIWEMVELITARDQIKETCASLLGLAVEKPKSICNASAIKFFTPIQGKIISIKGIEDASSVPGIVRIHLTIKPGDAIPLLTSSKSRCGYVLATGNDNDAVQNAINEAIDQIQFNIQ